jgi:hypothetical protein
MNIALKAAEGVQAGEELLLLFEVSSKKKAYWAKDTIILSAVDISGVGIFDEHNEQSQPIEIFPVPINDQFTIQSKIIGHHMIEITSLNG